MNYKAHAEPAIGLHFQTIQERWIPEGAVLFGKLTALFGCRNCSFLGRQISPFLSDKLHLSIKLEQMRALTLNNSQCNKKRISLKCKKYFTEMQKEFDWNTFRIWLKYSKKFIEILNAFHWKADLKRELWQLSAIRERGAVICFCGELKPSYCHALFTSEIYWW